MTKAQDLVYDGIVPEPGSEISSFSFTLKFDFSKVIEANGQADYGIGWQGRYNSKLPNNTKAVTIYKGSVEDGEVVGRCMTSNCTGSTATFVPSSEVPVSLDGVIPESGVTYTVVINNDFKVYTKESGGTSIPNTNLNFSTTPLIYTFVGASASSESITVTNCSLESGATLKEISEISYVFSQPVNINENLPVEITENGESVAKSISANLSEDNLTVSYKFDNVVLYINHSYVISLPVGAVSSVDNALVVNDAFNTPIKGDKYSVFELKSSIPTPEQKTVFATVEGIFDMPTGYQIYRDSGYTINLYGYLYKNEVAEGNLIGRLDGAYNSTRNGIIWTNTYALEPETIYVLNKPEGEFKALNVATNMPADLYNGEVNIFLQTPSVAESGIPQVEFQAPVLGIYNDNGNNVTLSNGDKVSEITTLDFLLKDLRYSYNGEYISPACWDKNQIEIYDITNGTPVLVTKAILSPQSYETTTYYYVVYRAAVNSLFYEGHKYRLVVPAGTVSVGKKPLRYYAGNEEYVVDFEGISPTTVGLISCSVADNTELSELSNIIWKFKGNFVYNTELSVIEMTGSIGGSRPTFVSSLNGETTVRAFFNATTGGPQQLNTKQTYTIILPEGLLYAAENPSIKNEELKINIIPIEKTPEVIKPEFVNVDIVTNDFMTTTQKAVKGESFTYSMTFDSAEWQLISAKQGSKNLTVSNGMFECPALSEDTSIDLEVDYKGPWASDEESTGIFQVPNTEIRIFRDGSFIVVDGVTPDNTINVYNVAGMLVNTTHVSDGHNLVRLTVAPDQLYIVMVDGVAAKIQM